MAVKGNIRKRFFFEKKPTRAAKQKTFGPWWWFGRPGLLRRRWGGGAAGKAWMPAFAGMTGAEGRGGLNERCWWPCWFHRQWLGSKSFFASFFSKKEVLHFLAF
jgi:hypothetical protein